MSEMSNPYLKTWDVSGPKDSDTTTIMCSYLCTWTPLPNSTRHTQKDRDKENGKDFGLE